MAKPDFVKLEKEWLLRWQKSNLLEKYLQKNKNSKKKFSFLDGPITANNPMGVHHAWGRALKDLFQRYKNMSGFQQRFQNGFDCQGLWVEVEVEKALGFNNKKDIEKYGLANFTKACVARVNTFAKKQTEQSKRLGYFMDWDHSYYTFSEKNNLYIWAFLKKCQQQGLIYQSQSATTWCPRCETGLSRHEQADSYKDITDTAIYLKFKVKNHANEYFLVWTTTPWTIPANVALAINPKHQYVKARTGDEFYYLAKESAEKLGLKNYSPIAVDKLLDLEYESSYYFPAQQKIKHQLVEWEMVDPAEGTGIVHLAPGCGEEDFDLGKRLNLPVLSPLDDAGYFVAGYAELSGKYAHDVADLVIDHLKKKNLLFKTESFAHSYPHCWRCGTKCLFKLENNWFINCLKIKPGLKKLAKKARWLPDFVGERMQNWLDNMGDWMISRKRFYGLALPFYECNHCQQLTVIGSKEELKKLAVDPQLVDRLPSLHRPWIDKIKIKCPQCQYQVSRITVVGDCWLDAGAAPFSTLKYLEDKKYWQKWFPAEFICEMVEQVRLWYYSMLVYGYIFENKTPYLHVLSYSEVRDEKGERISKTKKNGIPYDEAAEKIGIDVIRWLYFRQNPSLPLNFGFKQGDEIRRKFHLLLWNIYSFANIKKTQKKTTKNILDRWILSKLNQLIKDVTGSLDHFDVYSASHKIEDFVNDLSIWYVRRSRKRNCYFTLHEVLLTLTKLLAPFIPFLSEEIYQNLVKKTSVHLEDWPDFDEKLIDFKLEEQMAQVRKICELGHATRKEVKIRVRQPLASLEITTDQLNDDLVQLIESELNVKKVFFKKGIGRQVGDLKIKLDTQITPELKAEGEARDLIRQVQQLRKKAGLGLREKIVIFAPNLPLKAELKEYLKKQTLAQKLVSSNSLKITPV